MAGSFARERINVRTSLGRNFDGRSGQVIRVTLCRFFSDARATAPTMLVGGFVASALMVESRTMRSLLGSWSLISALCVNTLFDGGYLDSLARGWLLRLSQWLKESPQRSKGQVKIVFFPLVGRSPASRQCNRNKELIEVIRKLRGRGKRQKAGLSLETTSGLCQSRDRNR
jgi:hypothetical protein